MKAKPNIKFDDKFIFKLRKELADRAKLMQTKESRIGFIDQILFYKKYAYATAGVLAIILLIVSLPVFTKKENKGGKIALRTEVNLGSGIKNLGNAAFGHLSANGQNSESNLATGRGGGGVAFGMGGGGTVSKDASAQSAPTAKIMPAYTNYKYVYKGEEFSIDQNQMNVYKKGTDVTGGKLVANYLSNLDFNLVDLKKFSDANLQTLILAQDSDFGYLATVNFQDSSVDLSNNWNKWPHPESQCRDDACYQANRLKMEDVPADDKVLAIAEQFIKDYGIDVSHYGQPIVQSSWKKNYEKFEDKKNFWIPDEITVIYPLIIEGQQVYDEGGNPTGLFVGVNIRYNRVANARPIVPYIYESSSYEMITDKNKIISMAENGGIYPIYYATEENVKTIEIELGTPKLGLTSYWNYDQETGISSQLYVPSMIFPVQKVNDTDPNNYFFREYIAIPLAKEIVDKVQANNPPMPRPLIEGDVKALIEPDQPKK
jgi:hypothetical protein